MTIATSSPVDEILTRAWAEQDIEPAAVCSDDEFLRRATLDLIGRIPTVDELHAFRAAPDRAAKIDELLASSDFSRFQSELWTSVLVGYSDQFQSSREVLRDWLEARLADRMPYDRLARSLISAEGDSAFNGPVNFLLRHPDEPVVKVSRVFLGVRLDCARCHDHPFDRWTQSDFESMSRFFSATNRRQISQGNIRLENVIRNVGEDNRPRFLTGARPRTTRWRDEFALFATRSRPFARAFVNRVWYQLFGRGIVDPVDDFSQVNKPASRELLEYLADEAVRSRYDIRAMMRLICNSQAWQLSSLNPNGDSDREALFAVRTIRPLIPEQFVDSVGVALNRDLPSSERREFIESATADSLAEDFGSTWEYRETVQQLMSRLAGRTGAVTGSTQELFERILSRQPTSRERILCRDRPASDIVFALIHSSEFRFNH
jgi:hypothetical protein